MNNEKLIKFPIPEWNRVVSFDLDSIAYCICYQYNIDSSGFGPYGFNTVTAEKIISKTFVNLMYLEKSDNGNLLLRHVENIRKHGVYLYGNNSRLESLNIDASKYFLAKKKNELKLKKRLQQEPLPPEPLILNLLNEDGYISDAINNILCMNLGIIICHNYMPEAGQALILFDQNILSDLKSNASYYKVEFVEVSSIDKMKPW